MLIATGLHPLRVLASAIALAFCCAPQLTLAQDVAGSVPQGAADGSRQDVTRESLVSIVLNGTRVSDATPMLQVPRLGPVIHITEFEKLGLVDPKVRIAIRGDEDYVPLLRVKGLLAEFNQRSLELKVTAEVALLKPNAVVAAKRRATEPAEAGWGAWLNYDLLAYRATSDRSVGGNFETVLFSPHGSLVSNYSALKGEAAILGAYDRNVRLETYFQRDLPDNLWRIRLGDSTTATGSWGRAVRFGGLKFGTDFSLNPNLVTLPLLQLNGAVSIPSSVDLFINNSLQRSFNVPAGPFTIDQIPVVTGAGNARLVVRNNLGQDQVIEVPFFRMAQQLAKGASDYSLDIGAIRRNFGLSSNDYGRALAAGTWRYGVSESWTTEIRAEALRGGERSLGLAAVTVLPAGFSISPGVVASHSANGSGRSAFLSLAYSGGNFRINARTEGATEGFRQVGYGDTEIAFARRNVVNMGLRLTRHSDVGVAYVDNLSRVDGRVRVISASFNTRIADGLFASSSFNRTLASTPSSGISFSLNWVGQDNNSATLNGQQARDSSGHHNIAVARYSRRPEVTGGYGYDIEVGTHQRARLRGEVLGDSGQAVVESSRLNNGQETATRVTARGAVVLTDSTVKTSRVIDESFLMVKAPEVPGAKVTRGGGRQLTLDSNGRAIVDRVQPYATTPISVVASSLPIDATVGKLENRVAVRSKAGRVLDLAIKRTRAVTIKLMYGGAPVPSGSVVEYDGQKLPVGNDGLVYLPEIGQGGQGRVVEGFRSCRFDISVPVGKELIPDLGEVVCIAF